MKATEAYMYTKSKQELVPLGDPRGKFLAFVPGQEIPEDLAERSGLKKAPAPQNKSVRAAQNKAADEERKD